jgi:superfamily II DNA or RNA helicase
MGLGKTIQVIAFLTAAFGKTGDERDAKRMRKVRRMGDDRWYPRVLIICPGGLMQNWKNELDRWGWWQVDVFHGSDKLDILAAADRGRSEIVITTYQTYRLNESAVNGTRWDCVIADECHIIKERSSAITKAMNNINALCRLGLSGTAIQNNYEELWTLLNWANPGVLGSISVWKDTICLPLKIGQSHDATIAQLSKARRIATKLVQNLLPRFFLRRNKTLIADQLPKKSDRVVFCPLTETQTEAYNNFVDHPLVHAIRDSAQPCNCDSGLKHGNCCGKFVEGYGKWQTWVFPCLVTIQKLANHIALLIPSAEADLDKHEKELERLKIALPETWKELYEQRDSIKTYNNANFCGKWAVMKKLLRLWESNSDKVLVFSHSVRLLRMLQMLFRTTSYNVSYLDGSLSYEERQRVVDEYNSDPAQFVFLISTKAGGVGLNITSANKVVVVDPNWNPSYDLQAQDRAYRIGQTRDVDVFRLVSAGTVEEIVYARQIYKQQQANIGYTASVERRYFKGVQDQKDMKGEIFGLANLFAPQSDNVVLREIVNNTNIAETRAGVEIRGLDMEASQEDDDAELDGNPLLGDDRRADAAMSQLAAEIIDAPAGRRNAALAATKKKKDPVQAILASANVQYTHENSEVIGTSKIETRISSRAQRTGDDVAYIDRTAFLNSQPAVASDGELDPLADLGGTRSTTAADPVDADGKIKYRFRPPEDVCRRQFCTMAKHFGFGDDISTFALVVEGWTQQQRRDCLDRFYRDRKEMLNGES